MAKYIWIFLTILLLLVIYVFTSPDAKDEIIYLNSACIKPHSNYHYLTCHSFKIKINGKKITVPKNFDTDLASIPRWYWIVLNPNYSGFIAPSIVHDYLYYCPQDYTRKQIDRFFYYALLENGVSYYTAYKMYIAVRLFGKSHFDNNGGCYRVENSV